MDAVITTKTLPILETLLQKVKDLKLSNSEISRVSGKSSSTVSQVLNEKYRGRAEVVEEILTAITTMEIAETTVSPVTWLTDGEELIRGVLNLTYHQKGFSAVVGPSGLGKTFTAKLFSSEHHDVAYALQRRHEHGRYHPGASGYHWCSGLRNENTAYEASDPRTTGQRHQHDTGR